ncbi:HEPN domain-containing protein [Paraburkholderia dipogonis]|uniref:HEPN domain-containing protein n=1 Tax=Paraburkholderia dipogonis TaxID=1211383 RepID=A0ABW9ARG5_9BURK
MDLHRGQLDALQKLVAGVSVIKGSLAHVREIDLFERFENQIVKAVPWKDLIGRLEFGQIVWRTIYQLVGRVSPEYEGMLSDFGNEAISNEIVEAIRAKLESLPCRYDVYVPMAAMQELHCEEIQITDNVAISDALHDEQLRSLIGYGGAAQDLHRALSGLSPIPKSIVAIRYLRISTIGYGDDSPQSPAVRQAWSTAKQFIFVGMASGALAPSGASLFDTGFSLNNNIPSLVVARNGGEEVFRTSPGFELSQLLHSMRFKSLKFLHFEKGRSLLDGEERDATTGDEVQRSVVRAMNTAAAFLKIGSTDAAPVRAAMEWFIDADASQNETVAFLQRCIGLEALLGSSESRRDVTERLADRYSYLVANTGTKRDAERSKFVSMYKHRSEIVHGRSTRLSDEHRAASWDARNMLLLATWREMQNILKEADS